MNPKLRILQRELYPQGWSALRDHLTQSLISSTRKPRSRKDREIVPGSMAGGLGSGNLKVEGGAQLAPSPPNVFHRDVSWLAPELHRREGQLA